MNEIGFAKKTVEMRKIKEMDLSNPSDKQYLSEGLSFIFTRVANLAGIKNAIDPLNKQDIVEMILSLYKGLSLEEIDYAFKLDRYSGEPIQHFQLFNAEYVAKVLWRYKNWIRQTRSNYNLPLTAKKEEKQVISEEEKQLIIINGVVDCFETYKETGSIPHGKTYVYDYFYEKKVLPPHTKQFREKVRRKALAWAAKNKNNFTRDRRQNKSIINDIKSGKNKLKTKCKEMVLRTYFEKLIANNTDINTVL